MHYRLLTAIVGLSGVIHAAGSVGTSHDFPGVDLESHVQSGNAEPVPEGAVPSGASASQIAELQRQVAEAHAEAEAQKSRAEALQSANDEFGAKWAVLTQEEKDEIDLRIEAAGKAELQRAAVEAMTVDQLRAACKNAGVSPIPDKKADLVSAVLAIGTETVKKDG